MASNSHTLKPLLLHAFPTSPNPLKIAIALEFLRLPYTIQLWEFGNNPTNGVKSDKFLAITENGRVPVLEDPNSGVISWESGAVMNYLRRVYDADGKMLGLGKGKAEITEQDRVDFDKWEYLLVTTFAPMAGQLAWFNHYNAIKNDDAINRYLQQVNRCNDILEGQLKKSDGASILPGFGVTAVDLHWFPWMRQPEFVGYSLAAYPMIRKWIEGLSDIQEVKKAYQRLKEAAEAEGRFNVDADGKITSTEHSLEREVAAGSLLG